MRIVVTGGSGHIGRTIVGELLDHGHQVINADRQPGAGVAPLRLIDMEDLGQLVSVLDGCDAVVHAAAIPRPGSFPDHVVFRTNMMALFNVLEACRMLGIARLVWTSSMSVLGYPFNYRPIVPQYLPFDERHPQDPQDAYALSKAFGEQICATYAARCALTITSLRIVWAHTPETFKRDLLPFWDNPAGGASNLWSYVDTRDCGRAARLALANSAGGHYACFISAADTCMPMPTRELVARYLPDAPAVADTLPAYGALFDTMRARELLGFQPQYSWESYGLGTRNNLLLS
ncbi:MAG: NAD-dependent epimerase/dehydratase family protein [Roseiflexaceae bacterium]